MTDVERLAARDDRLLHCGVGDLQPGQRLRGRAAQTQHFRRTVGPRDPVVGPALDGAFTLEALEPFGETQRIAALAIGPPVQIDRRVRSRGHQKPVTSRLSAKPSPSALTVSPRAATFSAAARL